MTAGNASGVNDGAAALVVMSARKAQERGHEIFGTVESYASVGVEPKIMGIGPVPAVRKALGKAGIEQSRRRPVGAQRGVRGAVARRLKELGIEDATTRSTCTAARSPSVIRSARAAGGSSSRCCTR